MDKHECSWCQREVAGKPLRVVERVAELERVLQTIHNRTDASDEIREIVIAALAEEEK